MSEGLENRLISMIKDAHSFKDLLTKVKTKRYTYTHIQRVLMNVLLNIQQCDIKHDISAARILGMNENGRAYLKYLKRHFPNVILLRISNNHLLLICQMKLSYPISNNLLSRQFADDLVTHILPY